MEENIKFRKDLQVFDFEDVWDRETVILKDLVSGKFYYLTLSEYRLLQSLDGFVTIGQALDLLNSDGYYYSVEEASSIVGKAAQMGLLLGTKYSSETFLSQSRLQIEKAKKSRRLSNIYFFFIPLLNPDMFLEKTLWIVRLLANKVTAVIFAPLIPIAIYLVISGWDRIQTEYMFFFNLENLLYLWVTLALIKLIHEFAHAYIAKSFGLHVPQMGIAVLIFFPCLFCNTTDAWQLANRKQRMAIGAAGIITEAVLAVICTFIWYFTKPGVLNSLAFYIMAISFFSTVMFNGNPLMRFDGYFILMDFLRLPNLYARSLSYVKYLFMGRVLGLPNIPNPSLSAREDFIFPIYGLSAFAYRMFLYLGIAIGVYYRFDKTLGFILAALSIALFVFRPVITGLLTIIRKRSELHPRLDGVLVLLCASLILGFVLFTPIVSNSVYPCYVASAKVQKLTVPLQTFVSDVYVKEGSPVTAGQILYGLNSSELRLGVIQKELKRAMIFSEIQSLLLDDKEKAKAAARGIELARLDDEIKRVSRDLELADNGVIAPFDGAITSLDYRVQKGFQPGEGSVVGEVESTTECLVKALVREPDLRKISKGQRVNIWFNIDKGLIFDGLVYEVRPYSEQDLKDLPFSSRFGGELATEPKGDDVHDAPLEAYYQCSVSFSNDTHKVPLGMTGQLFVNSPPRSLAGRFWDMAVETFNRESLM